MEDLTAPTSTTSGVFGPRRVQTYPPATYRRHSSDSDPSETGTADAVVAAPADNAEPAHEPVVEGNPDTLGARIRPLRSLVYLFASSCLFCILYCVFIYVVLLRGIVETPGGVRWDGPTTNYIVSVLSMVSALLTDATLKALLAALRPALASRERGSAWASWVAQGGSGWMTVVQVAAANNGLNAWCAFRLLLPALNLAFGSILKFRADFAFYFVASNSTMNVYAGLITPDLRVLDMISAADISMFFFTWSASLLSTSMFALPWKLDGCSDPCRASIMPGSIGLARQVRPSLNTSIYSDNVFANNGIVRLDNATGMIVRYDVPSPGSMQFDIDDECVFTDAQGTNGLQVCLRQDGLSMVVAWSACPKPIYDLRGGACTSNSSWRHEPMVGTRMSLYTIDTTTSYDRSTQSIVDIQPLNKPSQIEMSAANYTAILSRVLIPRNTSVTAVQDTHNINALVHAITWMHRTYQKTFPDDKRSPVTNLHNLLAVPIQFGVTATVFSNYSSAENNMEAVFQFPLDNSMITVARGGEASSKFVILDWAGIVFIGVDAAVHLAVVAWVAWILKRKRVLTEETGIVEIDGIRAARRARVIRTMQEKTRTLLWLRLIVGEGWLWKRGVGPTAAERRGRRESDNEKEKGTPEEGLGLLDDIDNGSPERNESAYGLARKNRTARIEEGLRQK